eukprot:COSAG03_NODE_2562_length_2645_cov_181.537706_2_plen_72_part_00
MAAAQLVWTELNDQALLKLSGLPAPFSSDTIEASLPEDGARIRLVVGGTVGLLRAAAPQQFTCPLIPLSFV